MKQNANLTRQMAQAQEQHAMQSKANRDSTLFRIYTEAKASTEEIVGRYFDGFTILSGVGHYLGGTESADVIEIVAPHGDMQTVFYVADALRVENKQTTVIVSWHSVNVRNV